jgi:2-polyprenyl-6-methoxyphenol hydroxylase-like FAD-dependent oxidoreductase
MSVHWSLPHLTKILPASVIANLSAAYTDPFYPYADNSVPPIPFFNGPTGAVQVAIPAPNLRRLSRERFRKVLTQGLHIQWGKRLTDIQLGVKQGEAPVMLTFDDGSGAEADFFIGADGTNSKVRRWLLGEEAGAAKPSAWSMCSGIVCYDTAEKALFLRKTHPLCILAFTEHGLALCASMSCLSS